MGKGKKKGGKSSKGEAAGSDQPTTSMTQPLLLRSAGDGGTGAGAPTSRNQPIPTVNQPSYSCEGGRGGRGASRGPVAFGHQPIQPGSIPSSSQGGRGIGGRGTSSGTVASGYQSIRPGDAPSSSQGGSGRGGRGTFRGPRTPGSQSIKPGSQPSFQATQGRGGRGVSRASGNQPVKPGNYPIPPQGETGGSKVAWSRVVASDNPPTSQLSSVQEASQSLQHEAVSTSVSKGEIVPIQHISPGRKGRPLIIKTNYLHLDLGDLKLVYHYDVQIEPDRPKRVLRDVINEFCRKHFPDLHPASDGRQKLISPFELFPNEEKLTDDVTIKMGDGEKTFKVLVQFAKNVDLTPLFRTVSPAQEAIQCLDIILRSPPSARCIPAGRSFFTPTSISNLGEGMDLCKGIFQSVVRGSKLMLNVDVAHKAFPKDINIVDLIIDLFNSKNRPLTARDLMDKSLTPDQIRKLEEFLKNLRIVYEIPGQPCSKREYSVHGIRDSPKQASFSLDNGEPMTIEVYFATKKNYKLKFPLLPTLWVGKKDRPIPILLPVELCRIVKGQPVIRKATENQTRAMIKQAATSTVVREENIKEQLLNTKYNDDLCIQQFGLKVGEEFEQINARVLAPPSLQYQDATSVTPSRGVWRQNNNLFYAGANITSWTIISACGNVRNLHEFAAQIYNSGRRAGISLDTATEPFPHFNWRNVYRDLHSTLTACAEKKFDLVFVVIPNARSDPAYSYVKKIAEQQVGCVTQCIRETNIATFDRAGLIDNILLKVNSKLNGTNHSLTDAPKCCESCMIMGADVTHPSPQSRNIPSVAAVTASFDKNAFRYNIICRLQPPTVEIIGDFEEITRQHLQYYSRNNNGSLPNRIIFYRDGVSDGQFDQVRKQEVQAIRNACLSLDRRGNYRPKITFLVVQKRHHTRFFPTNPTAMEDKRNFNVPPGTCVDTVITNPDPEVQDFYLVSHASIQGVARPTKYRTLYDENRMSNDDIEELTYYLCHLFARCNRSVSYPAPTYYAHLAAARAKVYIQDENLDLENLDQSKVLVLENIRNGKPMFFV